MQNHAELVGHISKSILFVKWVIFLFKNKPAMQQQQRPASASAQVTAGQFKTHFPGSEGKHLLSRVYPTSLSM